MTTTATKAAIEQLLTLARTYELKAARLQEAARELAASPALAVTPDEQRINGKLVRAVALRASQRRKTTKDHPAHATPQDKQQRFAIIRKYLTSHPWTGTTALTEEMRRHKVLISRDRVRQLLGEMGGEIMRQGGGSTMRYHLRPPSRRATAHPRASKEAAGRKTEIVVGLMRDAGGPMTIKELVPLARAAGITALTGIANYVRQGYLRRTKKGGDRAYAFVAMPPSSSTSSSASSGAPSPSSP